MNKLIGPMPAQNVETLFDAIEQGIFRSHRAKMSALRKGAKYAMREAQAKEEIYTELYELVDNLSCALAH